MFLINERQSCPRYFTKHHAMQTCGEWWCSSTHILNLQLDIVAKRNVLALLGMKPVIQPIAYGSVSQPFPVQGPVEKPTKFCGPPKIMP
jgi:hypothetical protein